MFLYNLDCSDLGQWPSWPVVPHNHRVTLRSRNGAISAQKMWQANPPKQCPSWYSKWVLSLHYINLCPRSSSVRAGCSVWQPSRNHTTRTLHSTLCSCFLEPDDCASRLKALCDLYENDLPSPQSFESELNCWLMKWKHKLENHGENSLPTCKSLVLTLRHISSMYRF